MDLTFSCVAYANTLPFVTGLALLPENQRPRLLLDPPCRCAERFRSGEASVALMPSIEWARAGRPPQAGPFGIAARREVRSVLLFSKAGAAACRRIAVDSNSRTSVALLTILLARRFGIRPEMIPMEPRPGPMLESCDGALLIGDAALRSRPPGTHVLDLAEAWNDWTGLPFVFALWAARDAEIAEQAAAILTRGLALGMENLPAAVARAARELDLSEDELSEYVTRRIHYQLGPLEMESLDLFVRLSREAGLLDEKPGPVQEKSGT